MPDIVQPEWLRNHVHAPIPGNPNWKKGMSSPNPNGRPKGVLDKKQKVQAALRDEGPEVARVVLDAALAGDMQAAGLVLSRIAPNMKAQSQTVQFDFDPTLPIARQIEAVLAGVAAGEVPPDVGQMIISTIGTLSNVRAAEELAERLAILEARTINQ